MADSDLGPLDVVLPGITPWLMGEYFKDLGGVDPAAAGLGLRDGAHGYCRPKIS